MEEAKNSIPVLAGGSGSGSRLLDHILGMAENRSDVDAGAANVGSLIQFQNRHTGACRSGFDKAGFDKSGFEKTVV